VCEGKRLWILQKVGSVAVVAGDVSRRIWKCIYHWWWESNEGRQDQ
jgi:hypothetical protein